MNSLSRFTQKVICFLTVLSGAVVVSCNNDDDKPVAPQVTAITPNTGLPNALVAITGQFFRPSTDNNKVLFNGTNALVLSATPTALTVLVPTGATTGTVSVTSGNLEASNKPVFTVLAPSSSVTNVTPTTGGYGTVVTITGKDFKQPAEGNVVTFNGVPAVVQTATAESLAVKVPSRAGSGLLVVNGVATGVDFIYVADVFIVGTEANKGIDAAKVWKNGVPQVLSENAIASDILLLNEDVYVAGTITSNPFRAALWKNGVEMPLTRRTTYSWGVSVTTSGDDIYVAGYELTATNTYLLTYWKNGTPTTLLEITKPPSILGMTVDGTDITIAGTDVDGYATAWKNSGATKLSSTFSNIYGVHQHGHDTYFAGYDAWNSGSTKATYWKNGVPVFLTGGTSFASIYDIKVTDTDVYAVGGEANVKGSPIGKYWKNGVPTILSSGAGSIGLSAIDVLGDDVYIVGFGTVGLGGQATMYWKNGVPQPITDGGNNSYAYEIAVR